MSLRKSWEKIMPELSYATAGAHMISSAMLFYSVAVRICCANPKNLIALLEDIFTKSSLHYLMTKKLQKIIRYYSRYEECEAVAKYIGFHIGGRFTCIKIVGVQPTNNYAEQAIRETVLFRKIIGAFRSETGTKTYETLASLIATWQLQKLNVKEELTKMLSSNLC